MTALTNDTLGEAASEVTQGIEAEGWAVVYRSGGCLRPHTHHDSAWSGVYYVASGTDESTTSGTGAADAGYLQLLDLRPAAIARQATTGPERIEPVPGRAADGHLHPPGVSERASLSPLRRTGASPMGSSA